MRRYTEAAWERTMKVQEVILRAMAKRITWWQAAEMREIWVGQSGTSVAHKALEWLRRAGLCRAETEAGPPGAFVR